MGAESGHYPVMFRHYSETLKERGAMIFRRDSFVEVMGSDLPGEDVQRRLFEHFDYPVIVG